MANLQNEPGIMISTAGTGFHRVDVKIRSISDALELQRAITESIQMALADGRNGRSNSVCTFGDAAFIRFEVHLSQSEINNISFDPVGRIL